jgi:hypothetical protein
MTDRNSFQDFLKEVLVTEKKVVKKTPKAKKPVKKIKRTKYVSEALAGNSMPGSVSPAGNSGGSTGLPPFSKASTDHNIASVDMRDIGKDEENFAKSVKNVPYPLNGTLEFIAQSGQSLQNAQFKIESALKRNSTLTPTQKEELREIQQTIKSSLGNISKAAKALSTITL